MTNDVMNTNFADRLECQNYVHVIEELSHLFPDPASKLKFIKEAINEHYTIFAPYKYFALLAKSVYWKTLLDKVEKIRPGCKNDVKQLTRQGIISSPRVPLWIIYKLRHVTALVLLILFVSSLGEPIVSLIGARNTLKDKNSLTKTVAGKTSNPSKQSGPQNQLENTDSLIQDTKITPDNHPKEHIPKYLTEPIWLVEKKQNTEIYSNGLHIITTHTVVNTPRNYYLLSRDSNQTPLKWHHTNKISGISYHSSESDIYPFIPKMNKSIKRYSKALIRYIKPRKSYHYFIDRFGRVYRLVQEDHAAHHAGNSIWADDESIYLNLNHAFIGICFEGRGFEKINVEKPGERRKKQGISADIRPVDAPSFNEVQLRSGKELTDWLRVKYNIAQNNCVPHALTSVNPKKKLIGHHIDLSRGFPFDQFGLSDKYNEPLPSMVEFGFSYDSYFENIFDGKVWPGIRHAEKLLVKRARDSDMNLTAYVKNLQEKYNRYILWLFTRGKQKEDLLTNLETSKLPKPAPKGTPFG
jgi:hypothetical protein